jgi:hypothetical protein
VESWGKSGGVSKAGAGVDVDGSDGRHGHRSRVESGEQIYQETSAGASTGKGASEQRSLTLAIRTSMT